MTTQPLPVSSWLNAAAHHAWLAAEGQRLLAFAKASRLPDGFGNLNDRGQLPADARAETMNTARMTHSFAMAHAMGLPGYAELVEHGVTCLNGPLRDAEHGGWFAAPTPSMVTVARPLTCTPLSPWPPALRLWPALPARAPC